MRIPTFVSVIVPVLDAESTIVEQLEGLAQQDYAGDWEVLVVDNGCRDGTIALARDFDGRVPELRVIDARAQRGTAFARNCGVAKAKGDFLAFCDADDVVAPCWLTRLVEDASDSDLVGGALDDASLNNPLAIAWGARQQRTSLPKTLGFLPYALACNLAVWADVMDALGGWNQQYQRPGAEDAEFCWRAQLAGYRLSFSPHAVVRYRYRNDLRALARQHYGYGYGGTRLYRDFRRHGLPKSELRAALKSWFWLLARLHWLLGPLERRGLWIRQAAFRFGRLRGGIANRVLLP